MKNTGIFTKALCILCMSFTSFCGYAKLSGNAKVETYSKKLSAASLLFTENRGQVADRWGKLHPEILFSANSGRTKVSLTETSICYQFTNVKYPDDYDLSNPGFSMEQRSTLEKQIETQIYSFSLSLAGGNPHPHVRKENKSSYTENYYLAHCPDGIRNVSSYEKVVYEEVYPNIDWVVYSNGKGLKYDFIVRPRGNPAQIRLNIKDAESVRITNTGDLLMQTSLGEVREQAPVSYADGKEVATRFVQNADGSIGFAVVAVPEETTLTIDPSVSWATYYGGSGNDQGIGCAVDGTGNVYLSGTTNSLTSLATSGGFQTSTGGGDDAFLVKFDGSGARIWATYYGGSGTELLPVCKTDNSGNVYLSGQTASTSGIATAGAHQSTYGGGTYDAFLVKFDASGSRLWATYYGGADQEEYGNCETDASGNVYLSGTTYAGSVSGIATSGAYQPAIGGGHDLYIAKFDASGTRLWGTYFGGSGNEDCLAPNISIDNSGNVFLSGITASTSGIATPGAYQTTNSGANDAFLAKFTPSGSLTWATYFGGSLSEGYGNSICTDAFGNVYLSGGTNSTSGVSTSGSHQPVKNGAVDGFLAKFNSAGVLRWSTYSGGNSLDWSSCQASDDSGNVFLAGYTLSSTILSTPDGFQPVRGGSYDTYITKFDSTGVRQWASYYGGSLQERCYGIACAGTGVIYMSGYTASSSAIATSGAHQTVFGGSTYDAYLVKVQENALSSITTGTITATPLCEGASVNVPYAVTGAYTAGNIYSAELSDASGSFASPVVIGTVAATVDGTIPATIPLATATGTGYRIRVVSNTPVVTGTDNGTDITINPLPDAGSITGMATVCEAATTTLSNTATGGTWSSVTSSVATVDASGVVTGIIAGTSTISYTVTNSCGTAAATAIVTVNPLPDAGSITGTAVVCVGATTALGNAATGGIWSSVSASVGTIDASGVVTGVAAGTSTISYTVTNSCGTAAATATATVNPLPDPGSITGSAVVCAGATTALSNTAPGGIWSSVTGSVATVDASGVVSGILAGTSVISYTVTNSCGTAAATTTVTVNPLPDAGSITGTGTVCISATTALSNTAPGGTWSSVTGSVATIDASGVVTGVTAGISTISYTVTNSCGTAAATTTVTVTPLPDAGSITGTGTVCIGATTALSNTAPGGTWSSVTGSVATVDASGVVSGILAGTSVVSYTVTNSCGTAAATTTVTVNPLPDAGSISGTSIVCVGATTALSDAAAGGTWSSATASVATVDASGIVSGISAGTSVISYTVTNSCGTAAATMIVTVSVPPATGVITGTGTVCQGADVLLSSSVTGGTWSSSFPGVSTVDATGLVHGVATGTAVISYTTVSACGSASATTVVTVTSLPYAGIISGAATVCPGFSTLPLFNPVSGGTWSSASPSEATVSIYGLVYGVAAGTATISYSVSNSCGTAAVTHIVSVHPTPAAITGMAPVCVGNTLALANASPGGTWTSSDASVATVVPTSGSVAGVSAGILVITYTLPTGCYVYATVTVVPSPTIYSVTGGGSYCMGSTGAHIGLSSSDVGVDYQLYAGASPVGSPVAGTALPIDFGLYTALTTYTVMATHSPAGCASNMSGSATFTVAPLVVPAVTITPVSGLVVCSGTLVNYTATHIYGGTSPVYEWRVNGIVAGGSGATYSYTPSNGDIVLVKLTSSEMCTVSDTALNSVMMTVDTVAMPYIAVTITPDDSVCSGTPVSFTTTTAYGGTAASFRWKVNGVNVGTASSYSYIPADGDVVKVSMSSSYACRMADSAVSSDMHMTVTDNSTLSVTITANPGLTIAAGQTDTLTAIVTGGAAISYQWKINGTNIPGATSATYFSTFSNNDSVTCVVRNNDICNNSSHASVIIHVTVGVIATHSNIQNLQVMPNPNNGTFRLTGNLSSATNETASVQIVNMIGQVVYSGRLIIRNGLIDEQIVLNNTLSDGMYILNVVTSADRRTFHFVKK